MRPPALTWIVIGLAAAAAARRWLDVVEVRGRSMAPTLLPGDRLLVVRDQPRPGDVVLAPDPRNSTRELIKRVASVEPLSIELRGDNPAASTDARLSSAAVRWRAVLRYWPPARMTAHLGRTPPREPIDEGGEPACAVPEALVAGG